MKNRFKRVLAGIVTFAVVGVTTTVPAFAADKTDTGTGSITGNVTINGSISPLTISVTHPINVAYAISPDAETFAAPDIKVTNNTKVAVIATVESLKAASGGSLTFTDVDPSAKAWRSLNLADSKKYIALGIAAKGNSGWNSGYSTSTHWAVNDSPLQVGTLNPSTSGALSLTADYIDELRIIDDDVFAHAQDIMRQRTQPHSSVPLNCKGKSLLVGNIFCAHCGNRLTLTTSGRKKKMPDGTVQKEIRMRYQCHYKVRHPGECEGQSGYSVKKVDAIVDQLIRMKFSEITAASESEILSGQHEKDIELAKSKYEMAKAHLLSKQKELDDYKSETLKVIRGESRMNVDLLNTLVAETEGKIKEAQAALDSADAELKELLATSENRKREYDRLLSWADLYDKSSFAAKKMIVSQFIKAVRVGRDYNIEVDFNVSFDEFQNYRGVKAKENVEAEDTAIVRTA